MKHLLLLVFITLGAIAGSYDQRFRLTSRAKQVRHPMQI